MLPNYHQKETTVLVFYFPKKYPFLIPILIAKVPVDLRSSIYMYVRRCWSRANFLLRS